MQPSSPSCWTTSTWSPLVTLRQPTLGHQLAFWKCPVWKASKAGRGRAKLLHPSTGRRRPWLCLRRRDPPCVWLVALTLRGLTLRWTQRSRGGCSSIRIRRGRSSWRSRRRRTWRSKLSWSMWGWRSFPAEGRTDTLATSSPAQSEYSDIWYYIFMLEWSHCKIPSVHLSRSAQQVNGVCSGPRPILHPSHVEIRSVVFVWSCW